MSKKHWNYSHGDANTRLLRIWHNMKNRCYYTKSNNYADYGGRGITVCDDWKNNYSSFKDWALNNGYADDLSIDRINNNGNYEPDNCRWVTRKEQQRNRRSCRYIEYQGQQYTMAELGKVLGMSHTAIRYRLNQGWSAEEIANQKPRKWGKYHQDVSSLDKTKESNIKCENCRFFKPTDKPKSNGNCSNSKSPKAKDIVNYWNRCKCFDWKEI